MKRKTLPTLLFCMAMISAVSSKADLFSEGFESGGYAGWTVSVETDHSLYYVDVNPDPDGFTYVATNYPFDPLTNPYIVEDIGVVNEAFRFAYYLITPPEGNLFLQLTPGGGSTGNHWNFRDFIGPDGNTYTFRDDFYRVVLSREFTISEGQYLSLWANFYTEDYPPFDFDNLEVRIDGESIFRLSVSDVYEPPYQWWYASGWTQVTWTPPSAGTYTLSLVGSQDDQAFSSANFDGISIVPEPATWLVLMVGLGVLVWRKAMFATHR